MTDNIINEAMAEIKNGASIRAVMMGVVASIHAEQAKNITAEPVGLLDRMQEISRQTKHIYDEAIQDFRDAYGLHSTPAPSTEQKGEAVGYECEDCIGMKEHGCYCAAMGAMTSAERELQRKSWVIGEMMLENPALTHADAEELYFKVVQS